MDWPFGVVNFEDMSGWGAFGLLAFLVLWGFVSGRIQPRSNVDMWKSAYDKEREVSQKRDGIVDEAVEVARTATRVLEEIQEYRQPGEDTYQVERRERGHYRGGDG